MKKYIIAVGSEEISRDVQEALFRAGFSWCYGGGCCVKEQTARFLVLNSQGRAKIAWSNDSMSVTHKIQADSRTIISSQEVIADPFQLDGATRPAKELTVAEISAKLGYDVKVVKG